MFFVDFNKKIIFAIFSFIFAIFLSSFFNLGITFSIFLFFVSMILFLYVKFFIMDQKNKDIIILLIIFCISFAFGIFRYEIKDNIKPDLNLENNLDKKVTLIGMVSDEPTIKENYRSLIVDFKKLESLDSSIEIFGRGIISTEVYPELSYGDLVKLSGKLEKPENFSQIKSQSDGASFDYISYLAKDDILYKIDYANVEYISSGHGNFIKSVLYKFKNSFIDNLNKSIRSPESFLLSGIILGSKNSMDKNLSEMFRVVGLSHIIVLSGYNISIISNAIMKFFYFLPYNLGFWGGILGVILFVIMSGASSTAIRAGIMALIVIVAKVTHRNYQAGRALLVAGFLMILVNPKILVFDLSFQLSFLATFAIIYLAPILKDRFYFITENFGIREIVASTLSAQILVLPLILYKMGTLSIFALPVNILVLGFIPTVMFLGFLTGIVGFMNILLALPFAWMSWFLLAYIIKISEIFASIPYSSVHISWFSEIFMVISYIIIFLWVFIKSKKVNEK
jgi:competence protein ComEC